MLSRRVPLRLLTPANHGHAAWVYTSSYGGGLVDGDRVVHRRRSGPSVRRPSCPRRPRRRCIDRLERHEREAGRSRRAGWFADRGAGSRGVLCRRAISSGAAFRCRRQRRARGDRLDGVGPVRCRRAMGVLPSTAALLEVWMDGRLLVHDALALREIRWKPGRTAWPIRRVGRRGSRLGRCFGEEPASCWRLYPRQPVVRRAEHLACASAARRPRLHTTCRGNIRRAGRPNASRVAELRPGAAWRRSMETEMVRRQSCI